MKDFSVIFMKALLILLVPIVLILMVGSWLLIVENNLIGYASTYMRIPLIFLIELSLTMLLLALIGGLIVTNQYRRKRTFEIKTKLYLQVSSLGFIGCGMSLILLTYYLYLNNLWVYQSIGFGGLALFFLVLGQVAVILADVIDKGIKLQKDKDLTI